MKSAQETPKTYNRITRPRWFSAQIVEVMEYGTIRYAGQEVKDHLYVVGDWTGTSEVVPEQFLIANGPVG